MFQACSGFVITLSEFLRDVGAVEVECIPPVRERQELRLNISAGSTPAEVDAVIAYKFLAAWVSSKWTWSILTLHDYLYRFFFRHSRFTDETVEWDRLAVVCDGLEVLFDVNYLLTIYVFPYLTLYFCGYRKEWGPGNMSGHGKVSERQDA